MAIRQFRKQWLKWHDGYEKKAFRIIRSHLKQHAMQIPFERSNQQNVIAFLELYTPLEVFQKMYLQIYSEIGLKHGKRVGAYINKQINEKDFAFGRWEGEFLTNVERMLLGEGGAKIVTVRQNYIQHLMQLINNQYQDQATVREMALAMVKYIRSRNFYRYQALRIARTETTTASNYASYSASLSSKVQMEKVWLSAQDSRTRRPPKSTFDHYEMNEKRADLQNPFNVGGELLLYPGDQKNGSAGNIINCRCTIAQVVKRDANGNVIRTNGSTPAPVQPAPAPITIPTPTTNQFVYQAYDDLKDAVQFAKSVVEKGYNLKVGRLYYDKSLSAEQQNRYNQQLVNLFNKYKPSPVWQQGDHKPSLIFRSQGNTYGVISTNYDGTQYRRFNFGSDYDKLATLNNASYRKLFGKHKFSARVDKENKDLYTVVHEFAHTLTTTEQYRVYGKNPLINSFWQELDVIRKSYFSELNSATNMNQVNDIIIGRYAHTNADEFFAEAFSEFELTKKPSKYAKLVGELVIKYFSR